MATRKQKKVTWQTSAAERYEEETQRAFALYKAQDWVAAMRAFNSALALAATSEQAIALLLNRSAAALMAKDYEAAKADCEQVLAFQPAHEGALKRIERAKRYAAKEREAELRGLFVGTA